MPGVRSPAVFRGPVAHCAVAPLPRRPRHSPTHHRRPTMGPSEEFLQALAPSGIPPTLRWPVQFCFSTSVIVYALSVVTGNVSQVDRLWTFLPVIYTGYYALLPLWPNSPAFPLSPFTPFDANPLVASEYSPRALLMFVLQVRKITPIFLRVLDRVLLTCRLLASSLLELDTALGGPSTLVRCLPNLGSHREAGRCRFADSRCRG